MSEIPAVIDARQGSQPHPCPSSWQYLGLNPGGHEIYECGSGEHRRIGAHVNAAHECGDGCAVALTPTEREAQEIPGTTAGRDAKMIALQAELLDHTGHVRSGMAAGSARRLVWQINALRAANGWTPFSMGGRGGPLLYGAGDQVIASDGKPATVQGYVSERTRHVALEDGTGLQWGAHESDLRLAAAEIEL